MLEYVAKFTKLTCFTDDYMATNMAKVRKYEDGMKLSIRGKIVGLLLQDMNMMVKTNMAIKREVEDGRIIRDAMLNIRARRANFLLIAQGRSRGLLLCRGFKDRSMIIKAKAKVNHPKTGDMPG